MMSAFGTKLNTPPVIIGVKTNEGKKISIEQMKLRRVNSAADYKNYKE